MVSELERTCRSNQIMRKLQLEGRIRTLTSEETYAIDKALAEDKAKIDAESNRLLRNSYAVALQRDARGTYR